MKRFFILFVFAISLFSCSLNNDDSLDFYSEYLPIVTVNVPTEFQLGESYEISATYFRPTTCHAFNDFYYFIDMNQITVIVNNTVYENTTCEPLVEDLVEASFNFRASNSGTYIFKFWQGADENGNDIYYIVEVPVIN